MKRLALAALAVCVAIAFTSFFIARFYADRQARVVAQLQAAQEAERAQLEAALEQARSQATRAVVPLPVLPGPAAPDTRPSPAEIIERLKVLGSSGPVSATRLREAVYWLEELARIGPPALPAIRQFFSLNEEVEFDTSWFQNRTARDGKLPPEQVAPVSLRLALLEVVRRSGGSDAEGFFLEVLRTTGRGLEAAWVARALQELAPNKYRETALATARALLAAGTLTGVSSPLDRYHREYLFGLLSFFSDAGYTAEAQSQLVRLDGQLDRGALNYLQQTLGSQAVSIAAREYQNPLLATNFLAKEPLARLALSYVGASTDADRFWWQAINDAVLTKDQRRNLIEDLNENGFVDFNRLTSSDLPLIQSRIRLLERVASSPMDKVNADAFAEAYKDLVNMRSKITGQASSPVPVAK